MSFATALKAEAWGFHSPISEETYTFWNTESTYAYSLDQYCWCVGFELVNAYSGHRLAAQSNISSMPLTGAR